jgi:hypothetical protein
MLHACTNMQHTLMVVKVSVVWIYIYILDYIGFIPFDPKTNRLGYKSFMRHVCVCVHVCM